MHGVHGLGALMFVGVIVVVVVMFVLCAPAYAVMPLCIIYGVLLKHQKDTLHRSPYNVHDMACVNEGHATHGRKTKTKAMACLALVAPRSRHVNLAYPVLLRSIVL